MRKKRRNMTKVIDMKEVVNDKNDSTLEGKGTTTD